MFQSLLISSNQTIYYTDVKYDKEALLLDTLRSKGMNLSALNEITHLKRRSEWLTIRAIVAQVMPEGEDIVYDFHGKPSFKYANAHLSISHSNERVALHIDTDQKVGIDVQFISDKILRIKEKFLSSEELKSCPFTADNLTAYWSIKEALFKLYGKKDAYLKTNFRVKDFDFKEHSGTAKGIIQVEQQYEEHQFAFRKIDNYMMAYNLNY